MAWNPSYCQAYVLEGCPRGLNCRKRHDIQKCPCGLVLLSKNFWPHIRGKRHIKLFQELKIAEARQKGQDPQAATSSSPDPFESRTCDRCRKTIYVSAWDAHVEHHEKQERRSAHIATLEQAEQDKEGIIVSGKDGIDFGVLDAESLVEITITVQNTTTEYSFAVQSCRMRTSTRRDEHGKRFSARLKGSSKLLKAGFLRTLSVIFHPSYAGQYDDTLELVFFHLDLRRTFVITRNVKAIVGDREDHEQIRARAPYTGPREVTRFRPDGSKIVPSLRPPTWTRTPWKEKLPEFKVPEDLIEAAYGLSVRGVKAAQHNMKRFMPFALNLNTYATWWQVLLFLEEEQIRRDLDAYSLTDIELKANHPRYNLQVAGLAENRPSVLVGDFILVSQADSGDNLNDRTWYEGRVQDVHQNHVVLRFGDSFNTYRGTKFDVRFVLNRLPYRRMHHVLKKPFNPSRILFPSATDIQGVRRPTQAQLSDFVPFYRELGSDEEQRETVAAILNQKPGSVPFVVFGPPGTGKTVTIIEAIQQLLTRDKDARILACAPSNSAADLLAVKLLNRGRSEVFRLNSLTRKVSDQQKSLRQYSCINDNTVFAVPPLEELEKYRVVVATCVSGGVPGELGMKRGHFSHIFIDEAGQGKEPEVMVPIKSLAGVNTNVILAGDNQQLGPIVHSQLAKSLGLKTSFLARIMDRDIYGLDTGGRGITIVKLVKNFRSHPAILEFSNTQFYNSELVPCGDPVIIHSLENSDQLPRKGFPIIFHGIVGRDEREASSPSFFNVDEASQVKKYCQVLLEHRHKGLKGEHIGVITPYHAQRCKILDLLYKDPKLRDIKVGSVEEFQGQERRVIIMSTVRSNTNYVTSDIHRSLGFVANNRRMNVAITRAQAMLIVIGNPIVLSLDPLWRAFLNYIHLKGGWKGRKIDWNPEDPINANSEPFDVQRRTHAEQEMEDTIQKLKALIVQRHEDSDYEFDVADEDEDEDGVSERPILREAE